MAIQFIVLALIMGLAVQSNADLLWAESVHLVSPVLIWLALLVVYTQRKRADVETFETEELRRAAEAGTTAAMFEATDESLHLERARLSWLYRWFLPAFTVLLALFHIGIYAYWHAKFARPLDAEGWNRAGNPALAATFSAFAGFFCFMFSRYASGMARVEHWRMMRAASTYLAGNALACLIMVAAFGLTLLRVEFAEPVAVYVIRILLLLLGLEFAINFVLDLYRPKDAGEEVRPAFDSRLLALISEPGGIARSIADAINYQFGFEVSATWFYKLLQRATLPLLVFTLAAMFALSGVVIIDADQGAVIEHFGDPQSEAGVGPGIHFKWPWPVDKVYRTSVMGIRTVLVGSHAKLEADRSAASKQDSTKKEIILWTEKHEFSPHMMVIVASPEEANLSAGRVGPPGERPEGGRSKAVAVSMLMASVGIQYHVSDLHDYLYNYEEPDAVLEAVAYQALTDYAASVDIDTVIGPGRDEFEQGLWQVVEERVEELDLGIEITFVGLLGAHPPSEEEVAKKFQDVVAAEKRKDAAIENARGAAHLIKTQVSGSIERADLLDQAIEAMNRLAQDPNASSEARSAAETRVRDLLLGNPAEGIRPMAGQAAADIAQAEAARTAMLSEAESKRRVFAYELAAYQAAPRLYRMRKYLDTLSGAVQGIRKFVFLAGHEDTELIIEIQTENPTRLDLSEPTPHK